jgi:hypothetical protein
MTGSSVTPYEAGFRACDEGQPRGTNPFNRHSYDWNQWIKGYEDAEFFVHRRKLSFQPGVPARKRAEQELKNWLDIRILELEQGELSACHEALRHWHELRHDSRYSEVSPKALENIDYALKAAAQALELPVPVVEEAQALVVGALLLVSAEA